MQAQTGALRTCAATNLASQGLAPFYRVRVTTQTEKERKVRGRLRTVKGGLKT